jgi:DNA end-binding protein Ku
MGYSYKGSLSFGLVYIPITLHLTVKNNDIGFNMLDKKTLSRVQYKKTCVDCNGRELNQDDIVKGFRYEEDKYVVFTEEDFEKLKTKKDKNITIEQFVDISEIDPVYYDTPYYVAPTGAERAFKLLVKAMEDEGKVGIAKTILGTKETLIAIRAKNGEMLLNTLFFFEEVQKNPMKEIKEEINAAELELAKTIIKTMKKPFEPEKYKDEYRERVQKAIEDKIAGKEIAAPKEIKVARVANLMDALQASLSNFSKAAQKSKKSETYKPAKAKRA